MRTIIMSGPKRSGTTLINRLFDSQPGVVNLNDEAFFWEHVYKYDEAGKSDVFLGLLRTMEAEALRDGFVERDLLPWIEGVYRQYGASEFVKDLGFDGEAFLTAIKGLGGTKTVEESWYLLVKAYAQAIGSDYGKSHSVFIKAADYGRSILGGMKKLAEGSYLTIIRNPYYAIDSLKKARTIIGKKILNPFNFGEVILDYLFWWEHFADMRAQGALLIEYEELVVDPKTVMEKVADHLKMPYSENLITPTLMGDTWEGLSSFEKTKGVDDNVLKRKLSVLDRDEVKFIGKHLAEINEHFGYAPDQQSPVR